MCNLLLQWEEVGRGLNYIQKSHSNTRQQAIQRPDRISNGGVFMSVKRTYLQYYFHTTNGLGVGTWSELWTMKKRPFKDQTKKSRFQMVYTKAYWLVLPLRKACFIVLFLHYKFRV